MDFGLLSFNCAFEQMELFPCFFVELQVQFLLAAYLVKFLKLSLMDTSFELLQKVFLLRFTLRLFGFRIKQLSLVKVDSLLRLWKKAREVLIAWLRRHD